MGRKLKNDLTGKRFGAWTVIERGENMNGAVAWKCRCDCGTVKHIRSQTLIDGDTQGCMKCVWVRNRHPNTRYENDPLKSCIDGKASILYHRWQSMVQRCNNPNNKAYKNYGARGIKVCAEWEHDFNAYSQYVSKLDHYGEPGYTIDRINNDMGYEPGNIRYATKSEQARNKRKGLHRNHKKQIPRSE